MISMDSGESFPIMCFLQNNLITLILLGCRGRESHMCLCNIQKILEFFFFFPVALTTALGFACPQRQSVHSGLKMQTRMWLFLAAQIEKTG